MPELETKTGFQTITSYDERDRNSCLSSGRDHWLKLTERAEDQPTIVREQLNTYIQKKQMMPSREKKATNFKSVMEPKPRASRLYK